jgi:hypothetical protein
MQNNIALPSELKPEDGLFKMGARLIKKFFDKGYSLYSLEVNKYWPQGCEFVFVKVADD